MDRSRRIVEVAFYLILMGKSKGWAMATRKDPTEALEEHQFVSRLLSRHLLGSDLLLTKPYVYDMKDFTRLVSYLYD